MRRGGAKRAAVALVSALLVLAPPGTLIFALVVGVSLLRRTRVSVALLIAALVGAWFFWRRRSKTNRSSSQLQESAKKD